MTGTARTTWATQCLVLCVLVVGAHVAAQDSPREEATSPESIAAEPSANKTEVVEESPREAEPEPFNVVVPPKKKLDRRTRSELMAILFCLSVLGVAMVIFTWLGARMARRHMQGASKPEKPRETLSMDDWASKPLTPEERLRLDSEEW